MIKRTVTIDETCLIINGGSWSQKEFVKKGVTVIKVSDLKGESIEYKNLCFLPPGSEKKYKKNVLLANDLVVTTVGSHPQLEESAAGRGFIIPKDFEGALLNQNAVCIRTKDNEILDNRFLGYIGQSASFRNYIQNGGRGAASQMRIPISTIKNFKFKLPPLENQIRVTDILTSFDELIQNNLKRIKLLEQAAQNIYKEWFVNMRFPGYEEAKFDSETGLPEGWTLGDISGYGTVITGKTPSTKKDEYYGGDIPFIKTPDIHSFPYVIQTSLSLSAKGSDSQRNKVLPENSVLVSCIGTAGVVGLISKPSQTNQQINAVKFDKEFKPFYFYCFAKGLKKKLEALGSNGATMVNVNKSKFEGIKILIPSDAALASYHKMVEVNFKQILNLQKQIQSLKQARDILLPRLMNQTIEV